MTGSEHDTARGDLVAIARNASLYDWLLTIARPHRLPEPLPRQLRADLGLPPMPIDRTWPTIR